MHQVHGANGMMKSVVNSSGIDEVRKSQLGDPTQPLHERVIQKIKRQGMLDRNESINRIVEYFVFVVIQHLRAR